MRDFFNSRFGTGCIDVVSDLRGGELFLPQLQQLSGIAIWSVNRLDL